MACSHCARFASVVAIRGPAEFETLVERVRQAVADSVLQYAAFEDVQDLAAEPSFLTLDLAGPWPDVMRYRFGCPQCGQGFTLEVNTYHGLGGLWKAEG